MDEPFASKGLRVTQANLNMKRRTRTSTPHIATLAAAILLTLISSIQAQGAPNILFFFLDDMRWDAAGFTGNKVITTPNMDTLASQGTVFENAFTTTAICMVSRACVFMGQHMQRHGISGFNQNLSVSKWADSYPDQLDDAGYYMGFIGKQGLGNGFTGLYGTYDFDKGYNGQGSYFNQTIDGESANGRHISKFMGDLAIEFIGNATDPVKNTSGIHQTD